MTLKLNQKNNFQCKLKMNSDSNTWREPRMPDPRLMGTHTWAPKPHHYYMTVFCDKCERRQKSKEKEKYNFCCKWCTHINGENSSSCCCTKCSK